MSSDHQSSELARLVADVDRKMSGGEVPPTEQLTGAGRPTGVVSDEMRVSRLRDRHETSEIPPTERTTQRIAIAAQDARSTPGLDPTERLPAQSTADVATEGRGRRSASGRPRFRVWRLVLRLATLLVAVGVGYFMVTLAQVWLTGRNDDRGPVDAIVVMGAAQYDGRPSPQLAARLDHVVELWPEGVAPLIVVTGGNLPGDRFTEAEASAAYLVERGVPESVLVLEDEGSNSYESLAAVAELLEERGLRSIVIVTDPYHALRSRLIAEEVGLDAAVSSTRTSVVSGGASTMRHFEEAGGVAVGRLIGFRRLAEIID